jgi:DNA-binding MurR/RpiR family transcriptional regulator
MAFANTGWVCAAHGAGTAQLFIYSTADAMSAVDDSGYFNDVAAQLRKGDLILVSSATGGTPVAGFLIVTSATAAATVTTAVFPIGS